MVIAGDRGLAGGYNANVLKLAAQESGDVEVLPIGKRSAEYFVHHEVPLFTQEVLLAADITVGECFQLARRITEGYCKGEYDAVKICYTRFDSMMTQTATTLEVLPLSIEPTEEQKAEARRSQILYKPSSEEVFRAIGKVTARLHEHGYAHKDYGRANILFQKTPNGITIEIVDLNRMYIGPIDMKTGCKNFERLPATPQMHRWMAEEYAKARNFDVEKCFELMRAYRSVQPGKIDNLY